MVVGGLVFDKWLVGDFHFQTTKTSVISMYILQLKYELKQLLRSPMAGLTLLLLAACIAFGAYNGIRQVAEKRRATEAILDKQTERLTQMKMQADSIHRQLKVVKEWWKDPTSPLVIGEFNKGGFLLVNAPDPINALATGMSDLQPEAERIVMSGSAPRSSSDYENPVNLTVGAFDLAFVLTFLLPLFVIALTFNLISGEREQGTLALLRAQPLGTGRLFTFKMLARFGLLAAVVVTFLLAALAWAGVSLFSAAAWQAVGATLLYTLFWFGAVLAINLAGQSSAFNALAALGLWLLLVVVAPALVNMVVDQSRPLPTRASYLNARRAADTYVKSREDSLLTDFYSRRPDLTRKPDAEKSDRDWWLEAFVMDDFQAMIKDRIKADYERRVSAQADLAYQLMVCSPALAYQYQLTQIARTGRSALAANEQYIRAQQNDWSQLFRKKYEAKEKMTAADYDQLLQRPARMANAEAKTPMTGAGWLLAQLLLVAVVLGWAVTRKF
jgi:ABC-2 type transport system permease protein